MGNVVRNRNSVAVIKVKGKNKNVWNVELLIYEPTSLYHWSAHPGESNTGNVVEDYKIITRMPL